MSKRENGMYKPVYEKRSSKCFVFVLAAFVFCCAVLLVSAIVLRVRSPEVKLRSVTLNQISYNASPSASFNATVTYHLSIRNPNYGGFSYYENSAMRVLYAGVKVGDREINSDRVKQRETKEMSVTVNVRSGNWLELPVAGSDINSGTLNLTSYAKFSGMVQLLKIIHKSKTIEMVCIVNLNLTSHAIQGIQC